MRLKEYLNFFNNSYIKEKLFKREIEKAFFSGKNYSLPKVKSVTIESLGQFKQNFIFNPYKTNSFSDYSIWLDKIENRTQTIAAADEILNNVFPFFKNDKFSVGEKINWNTDYHTKFTWSEGLSWKIDYLDFPSGVDPEYAWHLGRFEFGFKLAKAYLLTEDEKYPRKFLSLLDDFINPGNYCTGIQWVKSSEVSIRLINCLIGFGLVIHSPLIDETVINSFIRFVLLHSIFIENDLEVKTYHGYEFLLNLLALGMVGVLFNNTQYGNRNLNFTFAGLEQEIRSQVYKDGVSIYQSIPYHRLVLKIFYLAEKYMQQSDKKFSDEYRSILKKLFEVQKEYIRMDGSVPAIGDDLNISLAPFNQYEDNRNILSVGASLFDEGKFKISDNSLTAEILFIYGIKSVEEYSSIEAIESKINSVGFLTGGHFILRKDNFEIFVEAGEIGNKGRGAPGHNDTLTFELYSKNKPIIVDPGTYSFYADLQLRNQLRSVKRHNTFYVDNQLLAEFEGPFKIKGDFTKPMILEWRTSESEDFLSVQHYAYARLIDPVIIKRSFNFQKEKNTFRVKDEFYGGAEHQVSGNLTFHPDVHVFQIGDNKFKAVNDNAAIQINIKSSMDKISFKILSADYSEGYGSLIPAKRVFINSTDRLPCFIVTEIIFL